LDFAVLWVAKGLAVNTDAYGRHGGGDCWDGRLYRGFSCATVYLHVAACWMRM
jgi:hypothetical protein